jgi:hypothetical protein
MDVQGTEQQRPEVARGTGEVKLEEAFGLIGLHRGANTVDQGFRTF